MQHKKKAYGKLSDIGKELYLMKLSIGGKRITFFCVVRNWTSFLANAR